MKRNLLTLVPGLLLFGLLTGCDKTGTVRENAVVSAEKNSFAEVAKQLDTGGNFYLYLSTEQLLEGISGKVSGWREVLVNLPDTGTQEREQIGKVFDVVTSLVKNSGIEDVSGFGMSSIATEKGFYRTKAFLHHYPGRGSGFLWNLPGEKPHALHGLDLLPAHTALASFSDVNVQLLWATLQKQVKQSGFPEAEALINELPRQFEQATGLPWEKVLGSFGGEFGIVLTLDESKMIPLPLPTADGLEVPEPGLLIAIKVKDDTIFNRVDQALKEFGMGVSSADKPGLKMRTLALPIPLPIPLRPTLAAADGWLFIATTDTMIEEALAVKAGKKPSLKTTEEFKHLSQGIPEEGNHFSFVGQRLTRTLMQFQNQAMQLADKADAAQMTWLRSLLQTNKVTFSYSVSANTEEGWLTVANGNQHPAKMLALPAVIIPAALISAIAVPNYFKAHDTSKKNACINNLRQLDAAKAQWALENNKKLDDVASMNDVLPYLRQGKKPACPEGGYYTLGPVKQRPTCSIPGHEL